MKSKLLFLVVVLPGSLLLSACNLLAKPSATPLPAPTASDTAIPPTALPTNPPLPPTSTPTVAPPTATAVLTPTEALPATPDPNQGVGEIVYEDTFNGANWGWFFDDTVATFSLANQRLNAVAKTANAWRMTSGPDSLVVLDQQVNVTTYTNICYPNDEYGVAFRFNPASNNGYVFKLSCDGRARLEKIQNAQPAVLVEWRNFPAIVASAPAENRVTIWAAKDQFHFYVNDSYLFSASDATFDSGTFAFYLRDRNTGGLSVSFANLVVKSVSVP